MMACYIIIVKNAFYVEMHVILGDVDNLLIQ